MFKKMAAGMGKGVYMGKQSSVKPVTKMDKKMSMKHQKDRDEVDEMPDGEEKEKKSMKYNISHAKEHLEALASTFGCEKCDDPDCDGDCDSKGMSEKMPMHSGKMKK